MAVNGSLSTTDNLHLDVGCTLALVLAFSSIQGLPIPISTTAEQRKLDRMAEGANWKVNSNFNQKTASPKEIDDALRSVMNPQQYSDFLEISKALKEEKSGAECRSQSNTDGKHDLGWDNSPDAIRLRLIAEAIAGRSG